jgi:hypothetical protein
VVDLEANQAIFREVWEVELEYQSRLKLQQRLELPDLESTLELTCARARDCQPRYHAPTTTPNSSALCIASSISDAGIGYLVRLHKC